VQVKAFLGTVAFASQQAARKANGGRGIIINAGGPHLLSSAIVTIKVMHMQAACLFVFVLLHWFQGSTLLPANSVCKLVLCKDIT
jgi:hypothetical protein